MKELEHIYFDCRESFRLWLGKNHDRSFGIWMIFHKKCLNIKCIEYNEALEEALCFGWIDSIIKKVNDNQYVRKFTPRTNTSNWSDINKKIVLSLIERGKMTENGLRKIDIWVKTGKVEWEIKDLKKDKKREDFLIPDFIINEFAKNEPALTNFNRLTKTYQRHYTLWITSAKREETKISRLRESVLLLKENRKLGLK
jgi:uncharacterized protein YdeI (YjbR/CyaY-like superfamily)